MAYTHTLRSEFKLKFISKEAHYNCCYKNNFYSAPDKCTYRFDDFGCVGNVKVETLLEHFQCLS